MLKAIVLGVLLALIGAVEANGAQLSVSWVDNSGGLGLFSVERRAASTTLFTEIADVPVGVTSYVDATVTSGTTYCYRVRAYTASAFSPYSNEACGSPGTALTISKTGTGTGTVVSTPAGIDCGAVCSATYPAGTVVTLVATAATGSTFSGWSGGGCAGTSPCTIAGNVSTTVTASFTKLTTVPTVPATLSLSYNGNLRDRVGQGTTARMADGSADGTLTAQLQASGGRTITRLKLQTTTGGSWDTVASTTDWLLGVATSVDGPLINNATTMAVNFAVSDGGSFVVFASESKSTKFAPGTTLTLTATFSDGTTATATARIEGLTVTYNGKLRDRVGRGNTARTADGAADGTLTMRLYASGGRTVTSLTLESTSGGTWDTNATTGYWVLGAATTLDGALVNSTTTMAVSFTVADGGSFVAFASDSSIAKFGRGVSLTLTAGFSNGNFSTVVVQIP